MAEKDKKSTFEMIIKAGDRFSGVFGKFSAKVDTARYNAEKPQKVLGNVGKEGGNLLRIFSRRGTGLALAFGMARGGIFALTRHLTGVSDKATKAHLKPACI